ncbi:endolytic transglycosylase MltG [Actinacidiphila bryophytorum]|uniref:Endolytic murein transglycosylase n=1 Tax=Actinacidiphila bryophytorum TaxID=1436133 RepID=A0A9W4MJN0_9ACTN|nr:endolytic transglycosylase MltG [Actinacidiphila bryophytorum]MBM9439517.1 endolytic transglycosylase MltG [Actinacidiphila bryophytorum]MBN6543208.1 endolytic transglycosylase MltG [Actinacidiphila bryophytorum]CAG7655254.1 Endolytic murein transglycosylase [Actinacidiphila bryophytorum]
MTDYGRGSGSEPWHPDDPLFGDAYDRGQGYQQPQQPQPPQGGEWQDPYATGQHQQQYQQQYPQQYPQQQYPQQGTGQYPQQPPPQQQYPMQHPQQSGYDGYDTGSHQTYDTGSHPTGGYGTQDPYGGRPQQQDPYGGQQQPGYYGQGTGQYPQQQPQPQEQYRQQPQQPGAGMQQQPPQGAQPGQPGPGQARLQQPAPGARPQEPAARPLRGAPAGTGDWNTDDDSDPREHAFFADRDRDDDDDDDLPTGNESGGRRSGKSQPKSGKKRRSGCACLTVLLVLGGGLAGGVYYGYGVYQDHFGPAPDYSGNGTPSVQVEIPKGSTLTTMGNLLKNAGVVKSVDAFTEAARKNPKGQTIQAGVYVLNKNMSAAAAVTMMLDPKSQSALIIPEGWRATRIYSEIDAKLGLKTGTTAQQIKGVNLGLPAWAKGNVEGFLFPAKYSVGKGMKPVDVVKQMVNQAKAEYTEDNLETAAKSVGKTPLEIIEIASLVQAEAQAPGDFGKVSRVVYNRLDQNMKLEFDSTINYAMGRSTLNTSNKDIHFKSPYNTYDNKGLPPGPIDSPGHDAIKAALNPTEGNWLYFVTVKPGDTRFTNSYSVHQKNVADFNAYQKAHG